MKSFEGEAGEGFDGLDDGDFKVVEGDSETGGVDFGADFTAVVEGADWSFAGVSDAGFNVDAFELVVVSVDDSGRFNDVFGAEVAVDDLSFILWL